MTSLSDLPAIPPFQRGRVFVRLSLGRRCLVNLLQVVKQTKLPSHSFTMSWGRRKAKKGGKQALQLYLWQGNKRHPRAHGIMQGSPLT